MYSYGKVSRFWRSYAIRLRVKRRDLPKTWSFLVIIFHFYISAWRQSRVKFEIITSVLLLAPVCRHRRQVNRQKSVRFWPEVPLFMICHHRRQVNRQKSVRFWPEVSLFMICRHRRQVNRQKSVRFWPEVPLFMICRHRRQVNRQKSVRFWPGHPHYDHS